MKKTYRCRYCGHEFRKKKKVDVYIDLEEMYASYGKPVELCPTCGARVPECVKEIEEDEQSEKRIIG